MKRYCLYKHERCLDAAINVLKMFYIPQKNGYKVKVDWYNVSYDTPFRLGVTETVFIRKDDINKWHEVK